MRLEPGVGGAGGEEGVREDGAGEEGEGRGGGVDSAGSGIGLVACLVGGKADGDGDGWGMG